jgi:hypothetical protein
MAVLVPVLLPSVLELVTRRSSHGGRDAPTGRRAPALGSPADLP